MPLVREIGHDRLDNTSGVSRNCTICLTNSTKGMKRTSGHHVGALNGTRTHATTPAAGCVVNKAAPGSLAVHIPRGYIGSRGREAIPLSDVERHATTPAVGSTSGVGVLRDQTASEGDE